MVVYMFFSFLQLTVGSSYLSQAEKETNNGKAEQIHKMTTIFTQNDNLGPFWVIIVVILWICSALQTVLSFSAWQKLNDSARNNQKLGDMY